MIFSPNFMRHQRRKTFLFLICALIMDSQLDPIILAALLIIAERKGYFKVREIPFYQLLDFDSLSNNQFKEMFRFYPSHLEIILLHLGLPDTIVLDNGCLVRSKFCLMILLKRLSYPCRLCDLSQYFGLSPSILSLCINFMLKYFDRKFNHLLKLHKTEFSGDILNEMS